MWYFGILICFLLTFVVRDIAIYEVVDDRQRSVA